MAHLLVTNETVVGVDQENARSIGKHKRIGRDNVGLTCFEGSAWPNSHTTKRQALASITNQPDRLTVGVGSNRAFCSTVQKKPAMYALKPISSTTMVQPVIFSSSFYLCYISSPSSNLHSLINCFMIPVLICPVKRWR